MSDRSRALGAATLLIASALLSAVLLPVGTATAADPSITVDYEGDAVTVAAAESQVISGSADLAPGTQITVRVRSTGDTQPRFFRTASAVVDRNGEWAVALDFSDSTAGDTFSVQVMADGADADELDGEVVACDADCTDPEPEPVDVLSIDGNGTVTVNDSASQVISGSALAPTGTEVAIRLRSTDSEVRFFKTGSAVVTEDRTWATAFDFSGIPAGGEFSVEATIEGEYVAEREGEVVACEANCEDQPPTDTPTPIPTATPEETATPAAESVGFGEGVVMAQQGETARIVLTFEGTDEASLVIGEEAESGYSLEATVRDDDGDGDATLRFDTAAAGSGDDPLSAGDGDSVVVGSETELDAPLATGEYTLNVAPGDRDATDLGSLFVAPQSTATPDGTPATVTTSTPTGSPDDGGLGATGIVVSGVLVLGGGGLALLLLRG